jgi:hypothetical protein
MDEKPFLSYEQRGGTDAHGTDVLFWVTLIVATIIGVLFVEREVHIAWTGRPGDSGVACFVTLSGLLTIAVVALLRSFLLRRYRPATQILIAAAAGLLSWVPAYFFLIVIWPLLFG